MLLNIIVYYLQHLGMSFSGIKSSTEGAFRTSSLSFVVVNAMHTQEKLDPLYHHSHSNNLRTNIRSVTSNSIN